MSSLLKTHAAAFVCPNCHGKLQEGADLACSKCGTHFPIEEGLPNFAPDITPAVNTSQAFLESPAAATLYEPVIRVNFVRVMGRSFTGAFTPQDEDRYLQEHIRPVDGPVLDLACGAGRWTRTVAEKVGNERLIGLDLSRVLLKTTKNVLPSVLLVRGNAQKLPFADASLGAVNCSNSLQLFPDPQGAIREVARCLRPGGSFTAFTYRESPDPLYRYFQGRFARTAMVRAFKEEEIRGWLAEFGFELQDLSGPNLIMLLTARKRG